RPAQCLAVQDIAGQMGDRAGTLAVAGAALLGGDGTAAQDREGIAAGGGVTGDLLADLAFSDEQVVHAVSWVQWLIEMSRARARRWGGAGPGQGRPGAGPGQAGPGQAG